MKNLITILMMQATALCCFAETRSIEKPDYMALFADGISIERAEFSDENTVLFFHAAGGEGSAVSFLPSTFLVDEQGNRYKAESSQGIELGERASMGDEGSLDFSISFEPLPEGTRVFDCIEGTSAQRYSRFYGIRAKGQAWDVFQRAAVADNPFPESFFRIDTIHVSGRISDSRYDRGNGMGVHYVNSNSQQELIRTFRENKGIFDFFGVAEDGTFSFKTLAAKPCLDALGLFGTEIPVLLIPGDHLHLDIAQLGEYNQRVTFRSDFSDYSRLLTNTPFMHDEEMDHPTFNDDATFPAQVWQSLREKQDGRLQICRYLSAKYNLTLTEQQLMQMEVRGDCALISLLKMSMAAAHKFRNDVDGANGRKEKELLPKRYTEQQLAESGITTDFSFLKECPLDNPLSAALPSYEPILYHLSNGGNHILFSKRTKRGGSATDEENLLDMARQLGFSKDIGNALVAEHIANQVNAPVADINVEKIIRRLQETKEKIKRPHVKVLTEAEIMTLSHSYKSYE